MLDGTAGISRAEERHRHSRSMIGAWPWSRFSPENVERSFGRRGIRSQNLNLEKSMAIFHRFTLVKERVILG